MGGPVHCHKLLNMSTTIKAVCFVIFVALGSGHPLDEILTDSGATELVNRYHRCISCCNNKKCIHTAYGHHCAKEGYCAAGSVHFRHHHHRHVIVVFHHVHMRPAIERRRRRVLLRQIRNAQKERVVVVRERRRLHLRVKESSPSAAAVVVNHAPSARAHVTVVKSGESDDSEHMWWKIGLAIFFVAVIVCACILSKDDSATQT